MSALGVSNLQPFGIDALPECIAASANLHQYFTSHQNADMSFVKGLKYQDFSDRMQLDEATIQSLDLVYNLAMRSA